MDRDVPAARARRPWGPGLAQAVRGAAIGIALATLVGWAVASATLFVGLPRLLLGAGVGLLLGGAASVGAWLGVRLLLPTAAPLAAAGVAALLLVEAVALATGEPARSVFAATLAGAGALGALGAWAIPSRPRRAPLGLGSLGLLAIALVGAVADRGVEPEAVATAAAPGRTDGAGDLDPGAPGPHTVRRWSYGSGDDRHRPEYAAGATRTTRPLDATGRLPDWTGLSGWLRTRFWGFGPERLPVNARVFMPEGEGPFPLVLVVHGNHPMERFSDAGYAYLGEHLASRGFAVASLDQNFLNRSHFADALRPFDGEFEVRAEGVLAHLRAWRRWARTPGDPLHGRIEVERVLLVGHSRGGEAVALAARRAAAEGLGVRGVVGLAPVANRVRVDGAPLVLRDVGYLVLHGSHDASIRSFEGVGQLERVRLPEAGPAFKAAVWIEGANHGQFNRLWGRDDLWRPLRPLLAAERLLEPAAQERATRVLVTAFAEALLRDDPRYRRFFRDPHALEAALPGIRTRIEFQASGFRVLSDYEEDGERETASLAGARHRASGLARWSEGEVERRWIGAPGFTRAVQLGWQQRAGTEPPRYAIDLPAGAVPHADAVLSLSLADADYARAEARREPIDLSVELTDAAGVRVALPLGRFGRLDPLYAEPMLRPALFAPRPEIVFRSFALPLAAFATAEPALDVARLRSVALVFDRTPSGLLVLDDLGWRAPDLAARGAGGS